VRVRLSRIPTSSEVGLDVAAYNEAPALDIRYTHFVRSGYVMLEPIWPETVRTMQGYNISDPPLTRWVCSKHARR
jgi:hypothetical protein